MIPRAPDAQRPVVVVGGGLAGLSASVALAGRGLPVTLCEQRAAAGGRTFSFRDATTGETVDNGQHVLIAGYHETMQFLRTIGTRHLLAEQRRPLLTFHHPGRGFHDFRIPPLPPPLHLVNAILSFSLLSPAERARVLRAGAAIQRATGARERSIAGMTVAQWLSGMGQPEEVRRSFWEPLSVSIMNEESTVASALLFVRSLRRAFLGGWRDASLAIPCVGLSELFVEPARAALLARGGTFLSNADVVQITLEDGLATGVRLRDGRAIGASAVILAVPAHRAAGLLPPGAVDPAVVTLLSTLPESPIISLHLWYAHDFMQHDAVGLIGKRIQWVFNKGRSVPRAGGGGYVSAVISAAHRFMGLTNEELARAAHEDLQAVFGSGIGEPYHTLVIREKKATFSASPGVDAVRPAQATGVPNLFLAGDWTATGLPATIEGAVLSARLAVERLVASLG